MLSTAFRYRWWFLAALFGLFVLAAWYFSPLTAPPSGSMEDLYKRVRVGMSQQEAVTALQTGEHDYISCLYLSGVTRDGRSFLGGIRGFGDLPPAGEIVFAKIEAVDNDGESVEVMLGEAGVVTGKKYLPSEDDRLKAWLHRLHMAFGH